jgi:exo-beta-1,3-glucanase (GH17 family)
MLILLWLSRWTAWVDSANDAVITACDFVGMDGYPYWQGTSIEDAYDVFFQSLHKTKDHVNSVHSGIWVW